ncbi:MAG: hypothetical protein ACOYOP_02005 [Microthrixaceae bacterium]
MAALTLTAVAAELVSCSSGDRRAGGTTTTAPPRYTRCQIHKALETMAALPSPRTPAEGKAASDFIISVYTQVADDAPPERKDAADLTRKIMAAFRQEGESARYSGSYLEGPPLTLQSSDMGLVKEIFREDYKDACADEGPTTTAPGG